MNLRPFLFSVLSLVAACGGAASPGATTASATPAGPVYAALLVDGTTWTVTGTAKTTPPLDIGPPSEAPVAPYTCTVGGAHAMGTTRMATITCDAEAGSATPALAGVWVASDAGLWWFADAETAHPAAMGTLPPADMLIGAAPVAGERTRQVDDIESRHHAVTNKAGVWCASYAVAAGDEAGFELCFPPSGVVTGSYFSAGATTFETSFTATPTPR